MSDLKWAGFALGAAAAACGAIGAALAAPAAAHGVEIARLADARGEFAVHGRTLVSRIDIRGAARVAVVMPGPGAAVFAAAAPDPL